MSLYTTTVITGYKLQKNEIILLRRIFGVRILFRL